MVVVEGPVVVVVGGGSAAVAGAAGAPAVQAPSPGALSPSSAAEVTVSSTAGPLVGWTSTAPRSHPLPAGRGAERWSMPPRSAAQAVPADSRASEPAVGSWAGTVSDDSAPRAAAPDGRSVASARPQEPSPSRLWPPEAIAAEQSAPAVWSATTEPVAATVPVASTPPAPLAVTVVQLSSTVPAPLIPAPPLPLTVAAPTVAVAPPSTTMPAPPLATTAERARVRVVPDRAARPSPAAPTAATSSRVTVPAWTSSTRSAPSASMRAPPGPRPRMVMVRPGADTSRSPPALSSSAPATVSG